jgi:hypothetical protein
MCLGVVSWPGAKDNPLMLTLLVTGMLTSVAGMGFRWASFAREQKAKGREPKELEGKPPRPAAGGENRSEAAA